MSRLDEARHLDELGALTAAIWGNPVAILKHDDHTGLEYIDLSGHARAFGFLGLNPRHEKILVREEYRTALRDLESDAMYKRGAYVTGQPGIGKSLFLAYILVTRLGNRQAVAWQLEISSGNACYVMLGEKVSFHGELDGFPLYDISVWALSDSSAVHTQPLRVFYTTPGSIKVVQATSPKEIRWKRWSKYAGAECYVMDIWSKKEVADLARLLNLDVERMSFLAEKWGGAPRRLLHFLDVSDGTIEKFYKEKVVASVKRCQEMLPAIEANALSPSPFYLCQPSIHPKLGILRSFCSAVVPTATLCILLAEALTKQDNLVRHTFFRSLRRCDGTRAVAGYIFENWFHSFLLASQTMECHWLQGRQGDLQLQGTDTLVHTSWSDVSVARPPYYWVAPKNFPGIDCALGFETEIYAFQVTLGSDDRSPIEGLRQLRANLPEDMRDLPWSVLFVGDEDSSAWAVADKWLGKVPFPSEQTPLAVGWSALDPVVPEIPWKEYRSQSESQQNGGTGGGSMKVDE